MAIITSPPTARRPPTFPGLFVPPVHLPFGPNFLQHPPPDYSPISPASTTTLLDVPAPTASPPPPLDVIAPSQPIALNTPLNVPGKEKVKSGLFASIRGKTAVAKDTLDLVFAESLVFIVPPRQDKLGLGMGDAGVDGDGGGKDGRINGFISITSVQRRLVRFIRVRLTGTYRLAYPGQLWREKTCMLRDIFVQGSGASGKEVYLEQGISTFEFSFNLPSTSPVSDRSPVGRFQYHVSALIDGVKEVKKEAIVVCNPHRESQVLQFQYRQEALSPYFGPFALDLTANEFIVAASFLSTLTLASPPPALTIFGIDAYLVQTTTLPALVPGGEPVKIKGPRRYIIREGARGNYASPGFAKRARNGQEEGGKVILDGSTIDEKKPESGFWRWSKVGRIPNDDSIRPSTVSTTQTSLRFSSTLVVQLAFNEEGPGMNPEIKIATLLEREVFLASCCCFLPLLGLPTYSEETPVQQRFEWKPTGCVGCMCDVNWDALEAQEIALMRGQEHVYDELPSDGMVARRTGQEWIAGGSATTTTTKHPH